MSCKGCVGRRLTQGTNSVTLPSLSRGYAAVCLLEFWVWVPPGTRMFVSRECCVLSGRERSLRRADYLSRGVPPTVIIKSRPWGSPSPWGLLRHGGDMYLQGETGKTTITGLQADLRTRDLRNTKHTMSLNENVGHLGNHLHCKMSMYWSSRAIGWIHNRSNVCVCDSVIGKV
jgi:hypothetical protein